MRRPGTEKERGVGVWTNWTRDQRCEPREIVRPSGLRELSESVAAGAAAGRQLTVAGSGHSFTAAALTDDLMIDLGAFSGVLAADRTSGTVKVGAGTVLADLNRELDRLGLAMANLWDPVSEYGQQDPLLQGSSAASGVHVYRSTEIPELTGLVLWADNPSGEIFWIDADNLPEGRQAPMGRILLNHDGEASTLLEVIRDKNAEQGRSRAGRADLRMASGPEGEVLLLNKADGVVRMLVP